MDIKELQEKKEQILRFIKETGLEFEQGNEIHLIYDGGIGYRDKVIYM